jgi:hypothetical protein
MREIDGLIAIRAFGAADVTFTATFRSNGLAD